MDEKEMLNEDENVGEAKENDEVSEDINMEIELDKVEDESSDDDKSQTNINDSLKAKQKEANDYLDKWQRTIAEFDNFRKRTMKEKTAMYENGSKEVLEKILPVIDNFERALISASEEEKNSSFVQGVDMIYKQLVGVLTEIGVEEIKALGEEFNPNLHHAVTHEDNEEYGENEVVEVFQKGYIYKDSVLRYSMVKVAN